MKKQLLVLGMSLISISAFANPQDLNTCKRTLSQVENKVRNLETQLNQCLQTQRPTQPQIPVRDTREENRLRDELRREQQRTSDLQREVRTLQDETNRLRQRISELERQSSRPGSAPVPTPIQTPGHGGNTPNRPGPGNNSRVYSYVSIATCVDTVSRDNDLRYMGYGVGHSKTQAEQSATDNLRLKFQCGVGTKTYRTIEVYGNSKSAICRVACLNNITRKADLNYSASSAGSNELEAIVNAISTLSSKYTCGVGATVVSCN